MGSGCRNKASKKIMANKQKITTLMIGAIHLELLRSVILKRSQQV